MASMAMVVHGLLSGSTQTDAQTRPPRLEDAHELGCRRGHSREEHVAEPHRDTVERGVIEGQVVGAADPGLEVEDPLRDRSSRRYVEHLNRQIGEDHVSLWRGRCDTQPRLTGARRYVEMLLLLGDLKAIDHR